MNGWLRELAARAIGPAVDLAARSVLATPDLAAPGGRVAELWRLSAGLANASYVLLITAGGVLQGLLHLACALLCLRSLQCSPT